jgi:hypothetical protein
MTEVLIAYAWPLATVASISIFASFVKSMVNRAA